MLRETTPAPTIVSTGLNGPALPGLLAQLGLADTPATAPSFVEGMGRWLGWKEAITLSAVLQAPPPPPTPRRNAHRALAALEGECARVQTQLTRAVMDAIHRTEPEDSHSFVPWRRRCFELQQAMEATIAPLRKQARAAVARVAPQLAALDAVLATTVGTREASVMAQMPALLDKHFSRLRPAPSAPSPSAPPHDTAWLATFRHDMQRLLLAELELRLQPTLGLLDSLRESHPDCP